MLRREGKCGEMSEVRETSEVIEVKKLQRIEAMSRSFKFLQEARDGGIGC